MFMQPVEIPFSLLLRLDAKLLFYLLHSVILTHFKSNLHQSWKRSIHSIIIWACPNATSWELCSSCPTKRRVWLVQRVYSSLWFISGTTPLNIQLKTFPLAVTIPLKILRLVWTSGWGNLHLTAADLFLALGILQSQISRQEPKMITWIPSKKNL